MKVHRLLYSVLQPSFNRRGELRHQSENILPLIASERRQNKIGEILVDPLSLFTRPHTDAQTRVILGAERLLYALQSVVSTRTSARANPYPSDRQLDFIDDNQQVLRRTPERPAHKILERLPAQVHVGLRLHQTDFHSAHSSGGDVRLAVFFPAVKMPNVGEVVYQPPADVVTCRGVLAARITEPDDDLQGLSNNYFLLGSPPPSPSPSSSAGPLPMTSGSAATSTAPSTASAAGASSITARGAATTATEVSGSF